MAWIYLIIAITSEVIATSALKLTDGFTKPIPTIIAAIGYISAFYFLALTLKMINIGIAYAIWCGLGIVSIAFIGYFFFRQHIDAPAQIGIALIFAGVLVISLFSKSIGH